MLQMVIDFFLALLRQVFGPLIGPLIGPFTRAISVRRQDDGRY